MACAVAGAQVGADCIDGPDSPGNTHLPGYIFAPIEGLATTNAYVDWLVARYEAGSGDT